MWPFGSTGRRCGSCGTGCTSSSRRRSSSAPTASEMRLCPSAAAERGSCGMMRPAGPGRDATAGAMEQRCSSAAEGSGVANTSGQHGECLQLLHCHEFARVTCDLDQGGFCDLHVHVCVLHASNFRSIDMAAMPVAMHAAPIPRSPVITCVSRRQVLRRPEASHQHNASETALTPPAAGEQFVSVSSVLQQVCSYAAIPPPPPGGRDRHPSVPQYHPALRLGHP